MTARAYVGTYAKYNNGSLAGKWLDLDDYASHEDFIAACKELHSDESDPELMFQDYEGPKAYYSESAIDPALWDWLELDEDDRDLLEAYQQAVDETGDIETAREHFCGKCENEADFVYECYERTGELDKLPDSLKCHIDWESVARDFRYNGWVFHSYRDEMYVFGP